MHDLSLTISAVKTSKSNSGLEVNVLYHDRLAGTADPAKYMLLGCAEADFDGIVAKVEELGDEALSGDCCQF